MRAQLYWGMQHSHDPWVAEAAFRLRGAVVMRSHLHHGFDPGLSVSCCCSDGALQQRTREAEKAPSGGSRPACSAYPGEAFLSGVSRMPPIAAAVLSHSGWPFTAAQILYFAIKSEFAS